MVLSTLQLVGCSSEKDADTKPDTTDQAKVPDQTDDTKPDEDTQSELEPYELHVVLSGNDQKDKPLVEEKMNELLKEKLNASIKLTFINASNWLQQTNLMIAGDEKIDLLWTSSFYGYSSVVARGQVIPIDDLLEKHGQDIVSVLGDDVLDACKIENKLYAVPSTRDMAADFGVIMRKDILEKHGIDISNVKTMEDLTPVLQAIKEKEPDIIPTGGHPGSSNTMVGLIAKGTFDILDDWFGVIRIKDDDMKVVNLYETPEYEEWLNIVRDWYVKGYISKDAATSTEGAFDQIRADRLCSVFYSFKPGIERQEEIRTGKPMVKISMTDPVATTSTVTVMMTSIAKTSRDTERAMMLLNLWFKDPNLVNLFDNGVEGVHYEKVSDNIIKYPDNVDAQSSGWISNNYTIGNNFLSYVWEGYDPDLWQKTDEFNKSAIKSPAYGFSFNSEPVKTQVAAVTNVMLEYIS